jgi:hypothetical protein
LLWLGLSGYRVYQAPILSVVVRLKFRIALTWAATPSAHSDSASGILIYYEAGIRN